ncbi:MAG: RluA family pseudouridine synthase [Nitrospirota bacterium]|nr:RluA family pseudouridine synthase [Nitrospirota bacterium]
MVSAPARTTGRWTLPLFGIAVHHLDAHLVVAEKPPGLLMHRTHPRPQMFFQDLLRRELWDGGPLHVVHRLDRETSGLVVLARDAATAARLSRQFQARQVAKRYLAVVTGRVTDDGAIDLPIGPATASAVRKKRQVAPPDSKTAQSAKTMWRVLDRNADCSLLEVTTEGGRQHQIRVHLAHAGHPLAGDKLYGPDERWHLRFHADGPTPEMTAALGLARHALHASHLAFRHPESGHPLRFDSPLPDDLPFGAPVPLAPERANP